MLRQVKSEEDSRHLLEIREMLFQQKICWSQSYKETYIFLCVILY